MASFSFTLYGIEQAPPTWETQLAHKKGQLLLTQLPTVTQKISEDEKNVEITIYNPSDVTLSYRGYSINGPIIYKKVYVEGKWEAGMTGFCGTGLQTFTLKPGEEITLNIHVPKIAVQNFMVFKNADNPDQYSIVKLFESLATLE